MDDPCLVVMRRVRVEEGSFVGCNGVAGLLVDRVHLGRKSRRKQGRWFVGIWKGIYTWSWGVNGRFA